MALNYNLSTCYLILQQLWDFSLGIALKSRQNLIIAVILIIIQEPLFLREMIKYIQ